MNMWKMLCAFSESTDEFIRRYFLGFYIMAFALLFKVGMNDTSRLWNGQRIFGRYWNGKKWQCKNEDYEKWCELEKSNDVKSAIIIFLSTLIFMILVFNGALEP